MMTPLENVRTVSSETPLYIDLVNGDVYYGRLAVRDRAQFILPLDGGVPVSISLNQIKETLPIPTPPSGAYGSEGAAYALKASSGIPWENGPEPPKTPSLNLAVPKSAHELETGDSSTLPSLQRSGEFFAPDAPLENAGGAFGLSKNLGTKTVLPYILKGEDMLPREWHPTLTVGRTRFPGQEDAVTMWTETRQIGDTLLPHPYSGEVPNLYARLRLTFDAGEETLPHYGAACQKESPDLPTPADGKLRLRLRLSEDVPFASCNFGAR